MGCVRRPVPEGDAQNAFELPAVRFKFLWTNCMWRYFATVHKASEDRACGNSRAVGNSAGIKKQLFRELETLRGKSEKK